MKYLFIFFLLHLVLSSSAQLKKITQYENNRIIVHKENSTIYAYVSNEHSRINYKNFYYWFASSEIKRTRGDYEGKLLHGIFTEFYANKNLKEKGLMKYGLKQGLWKSWHENGNFKELIQYKKSQRINYKSYYDSGELKSTGNYKNDLLHGKIKYYSMDGKVTIEKYKSGNIVASNKNQDSLTKDSLGNSINTDNKKNKRKFFYKNKGKIVPIPRDSINTIPDKNAIMNEIPLDKNKNKREIRAKKFLWVIPLSQEQKGKEI